MLTGKSVVRTIKGHFLVDAALNTLLVCNMFNIPLPVDSRVDDAVQTTDKPTGTEEQQEIATELDEPTGTEEQQENTTEPHEPTITEERQEKATEPPPTDKDLELV